MKEKMNIMFLGGVFSKGKEEEIIAKTKTIVHHAANKLQWNIIKGIANIKEINLEILSAEMIGSFPKDYKDFIIKSSEEVYGSKVRCKYVNFNNLWGYRNYSRKKSLIKEMSDFITKKEKNKFIIVYSPHTPYLQAAYYAKQKDPNIKICLIVPDLPQYMNLKNKKTFLYKLLKKEDIKIFLSLLDCVDSFVFLTEQMNEVLNFNDKPYIVLEGIYDVNEKTIRNIEKKNQEEIKTIVYTGSLNEKFGILNLISAFERINDKSLNLIICGKGDSEEIIKTRSLVDKRIKYLGQINNFESTKIQKKATLLINPRQNNEEFTKYSFPSKNIEYLGSGNPVIAYKLSGIPKEYDNYFIYVEDDTIESLSATIVRILNLSEEKRKEIGFKNYEFVKNHKNNLISAKKIIYLMNKTSTD